MATYTKEQLEAYIAQTEDRKKQSASAAMKEKCQKGIDLAKAELAKIKSSTIQSAMLVTLNGKNAVGVDSLEQAVAEVAKFRNRYDYGFGMGSTKYYNLNVGRIFAGSKRIGRVHYNGRVEMTA